MYFLDDNHRINFESYLSRQQHRMDDNEYLVAFYVNAVPVMFERTKVDEESPFDWTGEWFEKDEDLYFKESDTFLKLSSGERQLVRLGKNLFNSTNQFNLMEGLDIFGRNYLSLMEEMIRLRLNGLPTKKR